jgi:predicted nucleotidyltransferase
MPVTAQDTARYLRTREVANRDLGRERAAHLLARLGEAKTLLLEHHRVERVWLFGSLAMGGPTPESDIDLAVEGLAPDAYFNALAELMTLFRGAVDLVRLEEAPDSLRERVMAEGREL